MQKVRTEDLPEIVKSLNQVIDKIEKQEEEQEYRDHIPELTYSATMEDMIDTLNNILRQLQGE